MPISINQKDDSSILEVVVTGKLSPEDYAQFVPKVEQMVNDHGKIRLLFHMADFGGWEAMSLWDDAKFATRRISDISKIAMVGSKSWEKGMSVLCRPFTKAEIRYYNEAEIGDARQWLENPPKVRLEKTARAALS